MQNAVLQRQLERACREGETEAKVPPGSFVSVVKDMTDALSRVLSNIPHGVDQVNRNANITACTGFTKTYINSSEACMLAGRPAMLMYVRRVPSTQVAFQLWDSLDADVIVFFGDDCISAHDLINIEAEGFLFANVKAVVANCIIEISKDYAERRMLVCGICCNESRVLRNAFKCRHGICEPCVREICGRESASCPYCRAPKISHRAPTSDTGIIANRRIVHWET